MAFVAAEFGAAAGFDATVGFGAEVVFLLLYGLVLN